MKFGEFLVQCNLVSESDIAEAIEIQKISKSKLGRILVEIGSLSSERANHALKEFLGVVVEQDLVHRLENDLKDAQVELIEMGAMAGHLTYGRTTIFYLTEFDDLLVEKAEEKAQAFEIRMISPEQRVFLTARKRNGAQAERAADFDRNIKASLPEIKTPYGDLFAELLKRAKEQGASDVHFDIHRTGLTVRFRVNGDLVEAKEIKKEHAQGILTEVKRKSGLPLTVVGAPSGGSARFDDLKLKVRAQSNGQIHGESIVLRLIDEEKTKGATVNGIGADEVFLNELKNALHSSNGLILMCGQTGSGKSWTLYSILMSLDRTIQKVITIEDPVEYEGDGLMQIEVSERGIGFLEALKSCLRLDPDVIMVGEIRDEETAQMAFKAAATGHLVFSTLHTNGAAQAIDRLKGLGVDEEQILSNVRLISALTLKKRLCDKCKIEVAQKDLEKDSDDLHMLSVDGLRFYRRDEVGCEHCFRGAVGRALLCESIGQEGISQYINGSVVPGFRTLHQYSVELAALGQIGVEDAIYS